MIAMPVSYLEIISKKTHDGCSIAVEATIPGGNKPFSLQTRALSPLSSLWKRRLSIPIGR